MTGTAATFEAANRPAPAFRVRTAPASTRRRMRPGTSQTSSGLKKVLRFGETTTPYGIRFDVQNHIAAQAV